MRLKDIDFNLIELIKDSLNYSFMVLPALKLLNMVALYEKKNEQFIEGVYLKDFNEKIFILIQGVNSSIRLYALKILLNILESDII